MGGSEAFVLWWAESQGLSRTSDSRALIDITVLNHGWFTEGEFTKNDSVTTGADMVI